LISVAQTRAAKGFAVLSIFFLIILVPIERIAAREAVLVSYFVQILPSPEVNDENGPHTPSQHPREPAAGISAREQLRRRGSF
jgi:hypothetical protein